MSYKGVGEEEGYIEYIKSKSKIFIGAGVATVVVVIIIGVVAGVLSASPTYNLPPNSASASGVLVLVRTDVTRANGEYPVVARSYDGNPWELVNDLDFPAVDLECTSSCSVRNAYGTYEVRTLPVPGYIQNTTETEFFARFLSQATFGFKKSELDSAVTAYPNKNYKQWIQDQMNLPPTLLRSYFRKRANIRQTITSDIGAIFLPCEVGSRWHKYAFNYRDEGYTLEVYGNETDAFTLKIGGVVRGQITSFLGNAWPASNMSWVYPLQYAICDVVETVGGTIKITPLTNLTQCNLTFQNPAINFTTPDPKITKIFGLSDASFVQIPGLANVTILSKLSVSCSLGIHDAFMQYDGSYYRYDPRLKLLTNSLESPADAPAQGDIKCPAVTKNFVNNNTCIRRASCAPLTFSTANVVLNDTTIRSWFVDNSRVVYYVLGLRLESPYLTSACNGISRWQRLGPAPCPNPTALDNMTYTTFFNALNESTDIYNPYVRDITLFGKNCSTNTSFIGAQIYVNGECFQHVHPDLYSVRDFTYWSIYHDGNADAEAGNRPNPISKWADAGSTVLTFPSWHPMQRYYDKNRYIPVIGRYGDTKDFRALPTELQTASMAAKVGAIATKSDEGFEICGSPGEVSNDPTLGNRYVLQTLLPATYKNREIDFKYNQNSGKSIVWTNVAMTAPDQLRQRVAWALAQILTIGAPGSEKEAEIEGWTSYYDIFVRHAFGNYRDIMREVSYHPMMSYYLSFLQNKAFAYSNSYPDENYAREIMQLFSIGLWKLNEDGTQVVDSTGNPLPTYTNDDIVEYARLWTGFDVQQSRSNVESISGSTSPNLNDPLQIKPIWRDLLPKSKLDSGYLGDAYPLCDDLPPQHWLKPGARYLFTGGKSIEGSIMDTEASTKSGYRGRLAPLSSSQLYQRLCSPDSRGICTFPSDVLITQPLSCDGDECTTGRVTSVKIYDSIANVTKYYTYISVPCVRLTYFSEGKWTSSGSNKQCANPVHTVGNSGCCNVNKTASSITPNPTACLFANEVTDYATAERRCNASGYVLCNINFTSTPTFVSSCADSIYQWLNANCSLQVQVYLSGQVGIYDPIVTNTGHKVLLKNSGNVFRVRWNNALFPKAQNNCTDGCIISATTTGDTCICGINVTESVVYTDSSYVPSSSEIASRLFIGAAVPTSFGNGVYTKCASAACAARSDVTVWVKDGSTEWDRSTIFEIKSPFAGYPNVYLANWESIVSVGSYSFRNPPHFMPLAGEQTFTNQQWSSDSFWLYRAQQEVEALLDHLFQHQSTAPFVSYRLIQRMVTSNPSPRYMKSVVNAFKTGTYAGQTFSGKYGDLAAAVTAVLLDPEARTPVLEADPTFGVLREPLLKVLHVLRALNYQTRGAEIMLPDLSTKIGMEPFNSPSVFGFYLPENRPDGPISNYGLVSPEAQLGVSPLMVGFMNGMVSLIDNGLTSCSNGFGYSSGRSCSNPNNTADGWLMYRPTSPASGDDVVSELDLLLTNRRLSKENRDYIVGRYNDAIAKNVTSLDALKLAEKLIILTPEFHTTNANSNKNKTRERPPTVQSQDRPYKAIVVIFKAGGCDSYSMLVPHSNCSTKDLHAEYLSVRGIAGVDKVNLLPIAVPSGTQPCNVFGVNNAMPFVKGLYDKGEALFLANVGALVEPITRDDYFGKSKAVKRFPPSLFAHNVMTRSIQNLDPQNVAAKGVLGRSVDALTKQASPYKSDLYSLIGSTKLLEGSQSPDFIDPYNGIVNFKQYSKLASDISNFTTFKSESAFAETYVKLLNNTIEKTEGLSGQLTNTTLNTTFGTSGLSYQLKQVAKLIKLRSFLKSERAVFVTQKGGYDTHATVDMSNLYGDVDKSLETFVAEMKAQGVWDNVVVITISEFARTLSANGQGTDHAWGGNYFVAGGKVRGGQILGQYPNTLTDDGTDSIGRGRFVPTTSWDGIWKGLVEWFGVEESQLASVLPNLDNFPSSGIYSQDDIFRP
eukprot:TRINITY_DN483_c0_g1_i1.p1 TRINITY_DN483_c0_g1~~TRINITY_DN483_c0_g1_i1.p1  ORF type:complete len:1976 (+),score=486.97 TRINITY_DN483_c0_g1_i1:20-5947(+)